MSTISPALSAHMFGSHSFPTLLSPSSQEVGYNPLPFLASTNNTRHRRSIEPTRDIHCSRVQSYGSPGSSRTYTPSRASRNWENGTCFGSCFIDLKDIDAGRDIQTKCAARTDKMSSPNIRQGGSRESCLESSRYN